MLIYLSDKGSFLSFSQAFSSQMNISNEVFSSNSALYPPAFSSIVGGERVKKQKDLLSYRGQWKMMEIFSSMRKKFF